MTVGPEFQKVNANLTGKIERVYHGLHALTMANSWQDCENVGYMPSLAHFLHVAPDAGLLTFPPP